MAGTVTRTDGSGQVTVGGGRSTAPLRQNTQPGEAKGHGVGGTWFAIEPNGRKSGGTPASATGGPGRRL